ncbi:Cell division topological specificity factor [compost metagenome]
MFPSFLEKLLGKADTSAKTVAKDRLRLVLMHDRADIPGPMMEEMRKELLTVLSKYVEIDEAALEVSLDRADDTVALMANIPIRRVRPEKVEAETAKAEAEAKA